GWSDPGRCSPRGRCRRSAWRGRSGAWPGGSPPRRTPPPARRRSSPRSARNPRGASGHSGDLTASRWLRRCRPCPLLSCPFATPDHAGKGLPAAGLNR
ncbi:MAG: hypothetical protein EHM71_19400, partial [Zetaproteobacteria bacterium]